jgi:hypothetical protein
MFNNTAYQREWRKKNLLKLREYKRNYARKHKDKYNASKRAYRAANREKLDAAKRKWEAENPEMVSMQRVRRRIKKMNAKIDQDLRYHYDITLERYNELLAKQEGVCAICKKLEVNSRIKRLVVDHDHKTGKIRGLLCHRCNCGIGYMKDDLQLLQMAIEYLRAGRWMDE